MDKKDLFRSQQAKRQKIGGKPLLHEAASAEAVDRLLNCEVNTKRIESMDYMASLSCPMDIDPDEAKELVRLLGSSFDKERLSSLFDQTQKDLVRSIASPFGLGKVLAAYDRVGGNVTTVHNAKQGIYADEEDKYRRSDYTASSNSAGQRFEGAGKNSVGSNFTRSQLDSEGSLLDGYTGRREKASNTSPDHIVANSDFHKNGGYMLSSERKADFATDERNLVSTRRDINQSMRDHDKMEWKDWKQAGRDATNVEEYGVDEELLKERYERARLVAKDHGPSATDKAIFYGVGAAESGAIEGTKMGGQQAFGVLLVEFFTNAFEEIRHAFNYGLEGRSLFEDVKLRLARMSEKIANKWEHMAHGFASGLISGFISNLVTTFVNVFLTTGKRVVRMIREGVFSLLRALKTVLFPPPGISLQEASHEALKLFLSGGVVIAGVALEEVVEKFIVGIPVLAPISSVVSVAVVGSICAISMALTAYIIDRMDLFGVLAIKRDAYVLHGLSERLEKSINECDKLALEIDKFLLPGKISG